MLFNFDGIFCNFFVAQFISVFFPTRGPVYSFHVDRAGLRGGAMGAVTPGPPVMTFICFG